MTPRTALLIRLVALVLGQILYGFAISLIVRAHVGVEPWDAFALGVAARTGLSFGLLTNLIGALVLLAWIPLRQRPGLGTVLNVFLIGTSAQAALQVLPAVASLPIRIALLLAGAALLAIATGMYISAGFGPGPRDGLMTGLHGRFGMPIWLARLAVEGSVAIAGWVLGGDIGIGTVAFALLIGPLCARTLPWFAARIPSAAPRANAPHPRESYE